jgi:C-terminal processing protease CtpA/Prc
MSHKEPDYGTITVVTPGGPADRAGLRVGDKIVTIDGKTMEEHHALRGTPGTTVEVVVSRGGEMITVKMTRVTLITP